MIDTTLEQRLTLLEGQMAQLLTQSPPQMPKKDWRTTVGMFTNDPVMKEIQEEGRKIREADREQAKHDLA
ncbi:MAG TPA: hypothetical protein VE988_06825 [Gemmataceae bacterium]|nr:hypothetical protein [Gemmataceae bacterium]